MEEKPVWRCGQTDSWQKNAMSGAPAPGTLQGGKSSMVIQSLAGISNDWRRGIPPLRKEHARMGQPWLVRGKT
jgi:hypothetical protein